jgi:hypothetical protein
VGLEYRRAGGAEEILDSVIAATGNHPAWYFKECLNGKLQIYHPKRDYPFLHTVLLIYKVVLLRYTHYFTLIIHTY